MVQGVGRAGGVPGSGQVSPVTTEPGRVLRFLFVGLVNTGFSYLCFVALLWASLPLPAAVVLATVAGVLFNYFSFGAFVFGPARGWSFLLFVLLYAAITAVNYALLRGLAMFGLRPEMGQLLCLPVTASLSYLGMRFWVYAPARRPDAGQHAGKGKGGP
jgi:putative flippase GtrA